MLLLAASYYFYMCWKMEYVLLIIFSTVVDYVAGIQIERSATKKRRRLFLGMSLVANLGLLFFFKYYDFFSESVRTLFNQFNICVDLPVFNALLPVGISFYTFQTLSYTLDVYMGKRNAERHQGIFALYVAFFPQLVAGPIERSTHLMPQFRRIVRFDYDRVVSGLRLMLWGFVKKIVIADRLAWGVENAYLRPESATGLELSIATLFFAVQIFCDFSAYSDIAIGVARILGFDLMKNFRQPYTARSVSEFWRRWHISLSTWFKDYVYIPMGGNRNGRWRAYFNLAVVFLLSGLWHGASWTFVVWGALHAFYMLAERVLSESRIGKRRFENNRWLSGLAPCVQVVFTFVLVCYAWIFFRASSFHDAWVISKRMGAGLLHLDRSVWEQLLHQPNSVLFGFVLVLFVLGVQLVQRWVDLGALFEKSPLFIRWGAYYMGVLVILLLGVLENDQFIYFQF